MGKIKFKPLKKKVTFNRTKIKKRIKKAGKFAAKRGMRINESLAQPLRIDKLSTGI